MEGRASYRPYFYTYLYLMDVTVGVAGDREFKISYFAVVSKAGCAVGSITRANGGASVDIRSPILSDTVNHSTDRSSRGTGNIKRRG